MRMYGKRKGSVVVLVAVLMIALLGFGAFAVDISQMQAYKSELQRAADAAALAGALQLGDDGAFDQADDSARVFARANPVMGDTVLVAVEYGRVHGSDFRSFTCNPACSRSQTDSATAIRVEVGASGRFYLAQFLGGDSFSLTARATAWLPIDGTRCFEPWAIPRSLLDATLSNWQTIGMRTLRNLPNSSKSVVIKDEGDLFQQVANLPPYPSGILRSYSDNILDVTEPCNLVDVGDSLQMKRGLFGPITVAVAPSLCHTMIGDACYNSAGQAGVAIRVPIIDLIPDTLDVGCTDPANAVDPLDVLPGPFPHVRCGVVIDQLTFVMDSIKMTGGQRGMVKGIFAGRDSIGPVRGYAQRPILVQ